MFISILVVKSKFSIILQMDGIDLSLLHLFLPLQQIKLILVFLFSTLDALNKFNTLNQATVSMSSNTSDNLCRDLGTSKEDE